MIVHVAAQDLRVGFLLRQRCAWCGEVLLDYDLRKTAFAVIPGQPDDDGLPATWRAGALVSVDGGLSMEEIPEPSEQDGPPALKIPDRSCLQRDLDLAKLEDLERP